MLFRSALLLALVTITAGCESTDLPLVVPATQVTDVDAGPSPRLLAVLARSQGLPQGLPQGAAVTQAAPAQRASANRQRGRHHRAIRHARRRAAVRSAS